MIIKIKGKTDIIWPIVALYALQCYALSAEMFFVVCCFVLAMYIVKLRKIVIPRIPGMGLYFICVFIATGIGLTKFSATNVVSAVMYEVTGFFTIILGYYFFYAYHSKKSLWKTVAFMTTLSAAQVLVVNLGSVVGGADFVTLRQLFGLQITALSTILPFFVGKYFILHEISFSKIKDLIMMGIMLLQLLLNVSRIAIINLLIGLFAVIIIGSIYNDKSKKVIKRTLALSTFAIAVIVIVWNFLPDNITETFSDKMNNSLSEIDSKTDFNDNGDAQSDWRGYEISCAKNQWKKSNVIEEMFGEGNGAAIKIQYIPGAFKNITVSQNGEEGIKVLHNTYYTLLIKCGVISVLIFIYLFVRAVVNGIKYAIKDKKFDGIILVAISIMILVDAYVVRTMHDKSIMLATMLLFGWIYAEINNKSKTNNKENANSKYEV